MRFNLGNRRGAIAGVPDVDEVVMSRGQYIGVLTVVFYLSASDVPGIVAEVRSPAFSSQIPSKHASVQGDSGDSIWIKGCRRKIQ